MELHSYAKRKAKKWTNEHKRKLVEARIKYDSWFIDMPRASLLPWRKVVSIAKLDDYNAYFVRKQWAAILTKYKQYKQKHVGVLQTKAIDKEMIQALTQEWEFFSIIHQFMTEKTTRLHSYALTKEKEPEPTESQSQSVSKQQSQTDATIKELNSNSAKDAIIIIKEEIETIKQQQVQQLSTSSTDHINIFSSDTNEDFPINNVNLKRELTERNTDHDFYSKKICFFANSKEGDQSAPVIQLNTSNNYNENEQINFVNNISEGKNQQQSPHIHLPDDEASNIQLIQENCFIVKDKKQEATSTTTTTNRNQNYCNAKKQLSERDKYYRHKRHYNRRLEKRFDAVLAVFGQVVKAEYPNIDVSPVLGAEAANVCAWQKLFSNDSSETSGNDGETSDD